MAGKLIFVLGGARSGKSTYAQRFAEQHGGNVLFVATAQAFDGEMAQRIARHQVERPAHWQTLEASLHVGDAITHAGGRHDLVVVDCLTLLASSVLLALPEECTPDEANRAVVAEAEALLAAHQNSLATWLVVSNEVGMGVVPPSRLGRFYRDALGYANQHIARAADEVLLLVAGLPWRLK